MGVGFVDKVVLGLELAVNVGDALKTDVGFADEVMLGPDEGAIDGV